MTLPDIFIRRPKPNQSSTDDALMRLIRRGDTSAFRELYDRYKSPVFLYCLRMLNDRDGAKDVVQEVFIRVHAMCRSYKIGSNFGGWIHTLARNLCLNHQRANRVHDYVSYDESMDYTILGSNARADVAMFQHLAFEIENLPVIYRESLVLREYEGLAYDDIATQLGVTMATVKFRIFRAREILRERLSSKLDGYK